MLKSIFFIFDPMINMSLSLNWMMIFNVFLFYTNLYWIIMSRWSMMWNKLFNFLNNEFNLILKKNIYKINFMTLFNMIMLTNFLGLFSFIFTSTSHMVLNLTLALPFWMSFMLIGWIFNCKHMLTHQVPLGTPNVLMPFMVMIEFISNIIRPGTLSIRLTANMIAGHLLLTLISNNGNKLMFLMSVMLILSQTLLMLLELSVAFIQSYVFTILLMLYSQEI